MLLLVSGILAALEPRSAVAVLPSGAEFTLEIAADPEARARGYMGRKRVGAERGCSSSSSNRNGTGSG